MDMETLSYLEMVELNFAGPIQSTGNDKLKAALKFADRCRDKEIDRFWQRGLYFWGFIVSSFGAYMAVFNAALDSELNKGKVRLSLAAILDMSFTAKIILVVLAFICFIFCFSWFLVHKGSKFWQENWEAHVYLLEGFIMGKIYSSHLDTKKPYKLGKWNPTKPYNFSVSKISVLCSLLLAICSFLLFVFHCAVLTGYFLKKFSIIYLVNKKMGVSMLVIVGMIVFTILFIKKIEGNKDKDKDKDGYDNSHYFFVQKKRHIKIKN